MHPEPRAGDLGYPGGGGHRFRLVVFRLELSSRGSELSFLGLIWQIHSCIVRSWIGWMRRNAEVYELRDQHLATGHQPVARNQKPVAASNFFFKIALKYQCALFQFGFHFVRQLVKQLDHAFIGRKHIGDQAGNTGFAGSLGNFFQ